ncbi:MAG: EAL domain-containing protein [Xanthomonadales bacterium]|nr:EAL domain-containing protein [Xanthomonadales bacterium]
MFWTPSGRKVPVECTVYPLVIEGTRTGSVVAFRDVSERRLLEEELRWQAEHDALTQLPNRAAFEQQLAKEIERLRRGQQSSLLLFIDLDRFKYVNDTAGHSAGDEMLKEVGRRLRARLRGSDVLARMGGDEYAVILRNVRLEDVHALVEGFRRALTGAPFVHGGRSYRITLSIGVTLLDRNTASPGEAMAQADVACHLAKRSGRDQVRIYEPGSNERAGMERELGWSARLEEALRGEGFVLCFQPIVALAELPEGASPAEAAEWAARAAAGARFFEVLLRFREPSGELVSPHAFLSAAERFGLLRDIDAWVIEHALPLLAERGRERPIALSINLSADSLASEQLVERVAAAIARHAVEPRQLVFEISEAHSVGDLAGVERAIAGLRALGCRIAVDDFGTGFSTFSYIKRLEADFLKIDGSLLGGLPEDRLDRTVISSLVAIATAAGKRTVAECVENGRGAPGAEALRRRLRAGSGARGAASRAGRGASAAAARRRAARARLRATLLSASQVAARSGGSDFAPSSVTATAWITAAMRAALWIASWPRPWVRSAASCAATQAPQPWIAETARLPSSKLTRSTPGLAIALIRRRAGSAR